ncbi:MAG TPA: phosphoribosylamine--glycine ligase [Vicinamibacterales bacterium]|nr:phosphoribosylamine--glycine ligase [Vicinamibacterales bacterium]
MRVLVLGGGGREHALVARLNAEPGVSVLCAPGNPGIAQIVPVHAVSLTDPDQIVALAARERVDLTVVGPELPLSVGVADRFEAEGRLLVGPTAAAARLETSKAFAKAFMARHAVPSARFHTASTAAEARAVVRSGTFGFPVVLKADGLAAGKGVVIAQDLAEADAAIEAAMTAGRFGAAGDMLVIEECLHGPEVSFFVLSDGTRTLPLGTTQDHKRIFDDDRGPNTGGMGAFSPSPLMDAARHEQVMREIVQPVIAGMAAEGRPFRGFLYVGLMLTDDGPRVIEFNVRLGDPEAQVILPRIAQPLTPLLEAAARGALGDQTCRLSEDVAVGVVLASRGYPESSESGQVITGLADAERRGATVFHAGTAIESGQLVTAGGRVLTLVAGGRDFPEAIDRVYDGVRAVAFNGMQFRRDIGRKALTNLKSAI